MSFKSSVALRNRMLSRLQDDLALGFIHIFGYEVTPAAEPTLPSDAMTAGLVNLVTISEGGDGVTGLTLDTPASGIITKDSASWWGTVGTSGTAVCYRFCEDGDAGTASDLTKYRVQGSVGLNTGELLLASTTLTALNVQNINYYAIGLPSS